MLPSTQARTCTCVWMQAGRKTHFWLNMGLSLLVPAASVEAESTVTSLLDNGGDKKPTSLLVVGNMVTVLTPAGACYLAGCGGQGSFVLGNFNQFIAICDKTKSVEPEAQFL